MKLRASKCVWMLLFSVCALVVAAPGLKSQQREHVVATQDLQKDVQKAAETRQANESSVRDFVSSDVAQKALKSAHVDYQKVDKAIGQLNDEELDRLAKRTQKVQADFAAGRISDRDLLIIVVAIAALVLIIVAVR